MPDPQDGRVFVQLTAGPVDEFLDEHLPQLLSALPDGVEPNWLRRFVSPIAGHVLTEFGRTTSQTRKRIFSARVFAELAERGLYTDASRVKGVWEHAGTIVLNPYRGCNFGCVYCFRPPEDSGGDEWFLKGAPVRVFEDERLVQELVEHRHYTDETVVALHTATTDPFLPSTRKSTHGLIRAMANRELRNPVMIITKMPVLDEDLEVMAEASTLRFMLLLTYNAAPADMETLSGVASIEQSRWETLARVTTAAPNVEAAHYYRPIVEGWNDSDEQMSRALEFGGRLGMSVIGGLKPIDGIDEFAEKRGLPPLRIDLENPSKQFAESLERRVIAVHRRTKLASQIVKDQSCALTILLGRWGPLTPSLEAVRLRDQNDPTRNAVCTECSSEQLKVCSEPSVGVSREAVDRELVRLGYPADAGVLSAGHLTVDLRVSAADAAFLQFRLRIQVEGAGR